VANDLRLQAIFHATPYMAVLKPRTTPLGLVRYRRSLTVPIVPFVAFYSVGLLAVAPRSDIYFRRMSTSLVALRGLLYRPHHPIVHTILPTINHRSLSTSHNNSSLIECRWPYSRRRPSTSYMISVAPSTGYTISVAPSTGYTISVALSTVYAISVEMVPPNPNFSLLLIFLIFSHFSLPFSFFLTFCSHINSLFP